LLNITRLRRTLFQLRRACGDFAASVFWQAESLNAYLICREHAENVNPRRLTR
jgi:hypothetical protein